MTWRPSSEQTWKPDVAVEEARRLRGWKEFHRVCASRELFFDHPVRRGRKQFGVDAFDGAYRLLATGTGETVLAAIQDAHDRSGRADRETGLALNGIGFDDFDELLEV